MLAPSSSSSAALSGPKSPEVTGPASPPFATVKIKGLVEEAGAYTEQGSPGLTAYYWEAMISFFPWTQDETQHRLSPKCLAFWFQAIHTERDYCARLSFFGVQIFRAFIFLMKDSQEDPSLWPTRHWIHWENLYFSKKIETEFGPLFYCLDLRPFLLPQWKSVITEGNCIHSFIHTH